MDHYPLNRKFGSNFLNVVGEIYHLKEIKTIWKRYKTNSESNEYVAYVDLDLVPEPFNKYDKNAIAVKKDGLTLGYISRNENKAYINELHRLMGSGYYATVPGRVNYFSAVKEDAWINLHMPPPGFVLPLNDPPYGACFLIPPDKSRKVSKVEEYFDLLFDFVPESGKGLVFLELEIEEYMSRGRVKERVIPTLDGEKIGEFSAQTSKELLPTVHHFTDAGIAVAVYGELIGSSIAAELQAFFTPSSQLTEDQLDQDSVDELPHLIPFDEDGDYSYYIAEIIEENSLPRSYEKDESDSRASDDTMAIKQPEVDVDLESNQDDSSESNFEEPTSTSEEPKPNVLQTANSVDLPKEDISPSLADLKDESNSPLKDNNAALENKNLVSEEVAPVKKNQPATHSSSTSANKVVKAETGQDTGHHQSKFKVAMKALLIAVGILLSLWLISGLIALASEKVGIVVFLITPLFAVGYSVYWYKDRT